MSFGNVTDLEVVVFRKKGEDIFLICFKVLLRKTWILNTLEHFLFLPAIPRLFSSLLLLIRRKLYWLHQQILNYNTARMPDEKLVFLPLSLQRETGSRTSQRGQDCVVLMCAIVICFLFTPSSFRHFPRVHFHLPAQFTPTRYVHIAHGLNFCRFHPKRPIKGSFSYSARDTQSSSPAILVPWRQYSESMCWRHNSSAKKMRDLLGQNEENAASAINLMATKGRTSSRRGSFLGASHFLLYSLSHFPFSLLLSFLYLFSLSPLSLFLSPFLCLCSFILFPLDHSDRRYYCHLCPILFHCFSFFPTSGSGASALINASVD